METSGFRGLWWGANNRGIHFAAGPDWMHLMLEGLGKHILNYTTAILKTTGATQFEPSFEPYFTQFVCPSPSYCRST